MMTKEKCCTLINITNRLNFRTNHRIVRTELKFFPAKNNSPKEIMKHKKLSDTELELLATFLKKILISIYKETVNVNLQEYN